MLYAIFGPRDVRGTLFTDARHVHAHLDEIKDITGVILGGGKGVETFAEEWAQSKQFDKIIKVKPDIAMFGPKKAFDLRNTEIIHRSERVIVFWDGASRTAADLIGHCAVTGKYCIVLPL